MTTPPRAPSMMSRRPNPRRKRVLSFRCSCLNAGSSSRGSTIFANSFSESRAGYTPFVKEFEEFNDDEKFEKVEVVGGMVGEEEIVEVVEEEEEREG